MVSKQREMTPSLPFAAFQHHSALTASGLGLGETGYLSQGQQLHPPFSLGHRRPAEVGQLWSGSSRDYLPPPTNPASLLPPRPSSAGLGQSLPHYASLSHKMGLTQPLSSSTWEQQQQQLKMPDVWQTQSSSLASTARHKLSSHPALSSGLHDLYPVSNAADPILSTSQWPGRPGFQDYHKNRPSYVDLASKKHSGE